MTCPCGADHSDLVSWDVIHLIVEQYGENILVTIQGVGTWQVPRVYIAIHGLQASELPELAIRYGWPEAVLA